MRNLRLRETPQKPEVKWKQTFSRSVSQRSWECFGGACPQSTCFLHKSRGAFRHVLLCAVSTTGDSYIGRSRPCCTSPYGSRNLQVTASQDCPLLAFSHSPAWTPRTPVWSSRAPLSPGTSDPRGDYWKLASFLGQPGTWPSSFPKTLEVGRILRNDLICHPDNNRSGGGCRARVVFPTSRCTQ